jgi:hypothetical protein
MTETIAPSIQEALAVIDRGLADIQHRELLSASEVADLLLDVRLALSMADVSAEPTDGDDTRIAFSSPN